MCDWDTKILAELVTAHGRITLRGLVSLVSNPSTYSLPVLYGDTDSLFVGEGGRPEHSQKVDNFISEAEETYRVKLSKGKPCKILVLTRNKKQYVGIDPDGMSITKTMVGMKRDKTKFCQKIITRLISREFIEPFRDKANLSEAKERVLMFVRAAFENLESKILVKDFDFIKTELAYSLKASRSLETYTNEGIHKEIYREIMMEDSRNAQDSPGHAAFTGSEQVYYYYKIQPLQSNNHQAKKYTIYPEKYVLDLSKYREELFNALDPILEVLGFDLSILRRELLPGQID